MTRVYRLSDPDLPEELNTIKEIFGEAPEEPKSTREPGEGLHDYFMRKGIKCFCNICRGTENVQKNN